MHIDQYEETINACRFCFMCRHLSPVANVTCRESDTPRVRALMAGLMRRGADGFHPDFIEAFYRAELSGANRFHCVSHYDETGLVLAARRDIVEAGRAPEKVGNLAAQLRRARFKVEGPGNGVLYYLDPYSDRRDVPVSCAAISGGDPGRALEVLGFAREAEAVWARFRSAVEGSGCRTVVTSCPAAWDMMKGRLEGFKVLHTSEYLEPRPGAGRVFYLESDYLKNYREKGPSPRELLARCGYEVLPFGTNAEESYSAGEGAVVYDRLYPDLAAALCARVAALAAAGAVIVTASPYTRRVFDRYAPDLDVRHLDEVLSRGI